jgi:hypothetical protein
MSEIITFNKSNYDQIKPLPFNRTVTYSEQLANSMRRYGFIGFVILIETDLITGSMQRYLLDGHRRTVVASQLGLEFHGILLDTKFKTLSEIVKCVSDINISQISWQLKDYVQAYATLQYPEYLRLNKIASGHPYSIVTVATLLHGIRTRGAVNKSIQEGKFKCNLLKETVDTLAYCAKIHVEKRPLNGRMVISLHYVRSLEMWNEAKFTRAYELHYNDVKGKGLDTFTNDFMDWLLE